MKISVKFFATTFILAALIISSCGSLKKSARNRKSPETASVTQIVEQKVSKTEEPPAIKAETVPIKEVSEKILPVDNKPPDPHRYFVITGSFRNPDNAKKFQAKLKSDGFSPEILISETGFYRVSVMSTDDVTAARTEIRRIRSVFPQYFDTWLLIQIK